MAFSARATQAVETFAASLGLPARPARDGSYGFVFERSGTLTLTSAQDGVRTLLSLAARPDRMSEERLAGLLALAGPDRTTGRFLSVGLTREGDVTFVVPVDDEEMSLPTLETCLQQLLAARAAVG